MICIVKISSNKLLFSIRDLDSKDVIGLKELHSKQYIQTYPILIESPGSYICHVKCTTVLLPSGPVAISGAELNVDTSVCPLGPKNSRILEANIKKSFKSKSKKK